MRKKIRVGSRESKLAVIQTQLVMAAIQQRHPELELELVTMKTTGDKILDRPLDQVGGKGLFLKELDRALRAGEVDLTVHSLKDMTMDLPEDLPIVAYSRREDPRDALVLPAGATELDADKPIGCSIRRKLLLAGLYPGVEVKSVRGNVITRLAKLDDGQYGALVLASAGLKRLRLEQRVSRLFTTEEMIPAAGQGIIAVQGRAGENYDYLQAVNDLLSQYAATAERAFVRALDGGCSSPIAAYGEVHGQELRLTGLYYNEETQKHVIGRSAGTVEQAQALGETLARQLKSEV